MANKVISGLTIAIGADTEKFNTAMKSISAQARTIASDLKTVNQSLKIDPGDAESYADKLKLLQDAAKNATTRVDAIKQAIANLNKQYSDGQEKQRLYNQAVADLDDALKRGVITQKDYDKALEAIKEEYQKGIISQKDYDNALKDLQQRLESATYEQNRAVNALDEYQRETSDTAKDVDKLGDEQKETNQEVRNFSSATNEGTKGAFSLGDAIKAHLTSTAILNGLKQLKDFAISVARELVKAGEKLANFSIDAIKTAGAYQDALGYSETIFGEAVSKQAKDWVDANTNSLRIYKGELLENMNTFGQLFQTMGLGAEESFDMATNILSLAADLRAATGKETSEILESLTAGFTNTTRALRQFGVRISEAEIKAYALDKGIVQVEVDQTKLRDATLKVHEAVAKQEKAFDEYGESSLEYERATVNVTKAEEALDTLLNGKVDTLTAAERSTAIYKMMLEQLEPVIGQNERESGLFNSQLAEFDTRMKNLKETIGEQLLPVATELLTSFNEFLESAEGQAVLDSIIAQFKEWGNTIQGWIEDGTIQQFFSDMGERIPQVVETVGNLTNEIISLVPQIADLVEKLLSLFGIKTEAEKFRLETKESLKGVVNSIDDLARAYSTDSETIRTAISIFAEEHGIAVKDIYDDWETYEPQIIEYLNNIKTSYNAELIDGAYDIISKFAKDNNLSLNDIYNNWGYWMPQIINSAKELGDGYDAKFSDAWSYLNLFAERHGISLGEVLENWSIYEPQIKIWYDTLSEQTNGMEQAVDDALGKLPEDAQNRVNEFSSIDYTPMDSFREKVRQWAHSIIDFFTEVKNLSKNPDYITDSSLISQSTPDWQYGEGSWNPYDPFRASGGKVQAGQLYRVNDDAGHRDEWFVPSQNGYILNGNQTDRIVNNNNQRSVGSVNIFVESHGMNIAEVADELGEAFTNRLRMSGSTL